MKPLILILVCILVTNCSDNNIESSTVIDTDIGLEYVNEKGEDLLNPNSENHYNENTLKVFYLVDGEKKEIFRSNLAYPKMFEISASKDSESIIRYGLTLFLNDLSDEKIKTTYLQLNENDTDTITHTLQQTDNYNKVIDKMWYNGNLSADGHTFKIVK